MGPLQNASCVSALSEDQDPSVGARRLGSWADFLCPAKAVLQGLLHRIQWDKGLAVRFFRPLPSRTEAKSVMLGPRVSFGRPVLARVGVSTAVIVDRINAGEEAADLAKDYGATYEEIVDALAYERAA